MQVSKVYACNLTAHSPKVYKKPAVNSAKKPAAAGDYINFKGKSKNFNKTFNKAFFAILLTAATLTGCLRSDAAHFRWNKDETGNVNDSNSVTENIDTAAEPSSYTRKPYINTAVTRQGGEKESERENKAEGSAVNEYSDSTPDEFMQEKAPKPLGEKMVELAEKFAGYTEYEFEEETDYSLPDGLWCAAFVKYVATEVLKDALPEWYAECGYNKCENVLLAAKENDAAFTDIEDVKTGDIVIFKTRRSPTGHMGLVSSIDENNVMTTVEGNVGEKAVINTYNLNEKNPVTSFVRLVG